MYKVFVENLVFIGKHGVAGAERSMPREFHIDICAELSTPKATASDDIDDTVNYKDLADVAREIVEGPSCHLIETLATNIAGRILKNRNVKAVSVTIRKPGAIPAGVPGVTIELK